MALVLMLALAGGAVATAVGLVRATRAEGVAVRREANARKLAPVLERYLASALPDAEDAPGYRVGQLLDDNAARLADDAARMCQEAFGPRHPTTARALHAHGDRHYSRREYAEAEACYQEALAIATRCYGKRFHVATTESVYSLPCGCWTNSSGTTRRTS